MMLTLYHNVQKEVRDGQPTQGCLLESYYHDYYVLVRSVCLSL